MSTTGHNPNEASDPNAGVFGLPIDPESAQVIFVPVPWEATTSYGGGTVHGPHAIIEASPQIDLYDLDVLNPYEAGFYCPPVDPKIIQLNDQASRLAAPIKLDPKEGLTTLKDNLEQVNQASHQLNQTVRDRTLAILSQQKVPGIIGGDHSVPYGAFQAAAEYCGDFGILHFDAHSDTRKAYMGFTHSHASIMYNAATTIPEITRFVQIGIRDFCQDELDFVKSQGERFHVFFDQAISDHRLSGKAFHQLVEQMLAPLPKQVWVSFDIDGLDPRYCPHTGTPVPGGLDYLEAIYILRKLAQSGRTIIGFDVVEVAPPLDDNGIPIEPKQAFDEWDANVGMRLIYKLSALAVASQKRRPWNSR